jgi:hypothetical protein
VMEGNSRPQEDPRRSRMSRVHCPWLFRPAHCDLRGQDRA